MFGMLIAAAGIHAIYTQQRILSEFGDLKELELGLRDLAGREDPLPRYTLDKLVKKKVIRQASLDFIRRNDVTFCPFGSDDPDSAVVAKGAIKGRPFTLTKGDIVNSPRESKRPEDRVDIEFSRLLTQQETFALFDHLRGLVDGGKYSVSASDWKNKTEISVQPITDETRFISSIDFGRAEKIGAKQLRVSLDEHKLKELLTARQTKNTCSQSHSIRTVIRP